MERLPYPLPGRSSYANILPKGVMTSKFSLLSMLRILCYTLFSRFLRQIFSMFSHISRLGPHFRCHLIAGSIDTTILLVLCYLPNNHTASCLSACLCSTIFSPFLSILDTFKAKYILNAISSSSIAVRRYVYRVNLLEYHPEFSARLR